MNDLIFQLPFNGDGYIAYEITKLIKQFNVATIMETGTYKGDSTLFFAKTGLRTHSIEINQIYHNIAKTKLAMHNFTNLFLHVGNSPDVLRNILKNAERPVLFYLDAHWGSTPLLDELKVIGNFKLNDSVIAIHDFKVPGKAFGFDKAGNNDYEWSCIKDKIKAIYNNGDENNYHYYYNDKAAGSCRGIIYITKKVS